MWKDPSKFKKIEREKMIIESNCPLLDDCYILVDEAYFKTKCSGFYGSCFYYENSKKKFPKQWKEQERKT